MPDLFDDDDKARDFDPRAFMERAEALAREIPDEPHRMRGGRGAAVARVLDRIRDLLDKLSRLARAIDPVRHSDIYDPSHPTAAADLIAEKVERSPQHPLGRIEPFWGAGVYAIYYHGDHPAYEVISGRDIPIYVGKADPAAPVAVTSFEQGQRLHVRLKEHAQSIRKAERHVIAMSEEERAEAGLHPIRIEDFTCRFLVLASAYAGAVERNLIRHYAPVWNLETGVCVGFGKHGDKATTRANTRSDWDTIHPGRPWATAEANVPNPRTPRQIEDTILRHSRAKFGEEAAG